MMTIENQNRAGAQCLSERTERDWRISRPSITIYLSLWRTFHLGAHPEHIVNRPCFSDSLESVAMLEAVLTDDEFGAYRQQLGELSGAFRRDITGTQSCRAFHCATPALRLQACLQALGLWTDDDIQPAHLSAEYERGAGEELRV